jgi:hypothetical protein
MHKFVANISSKRTRRYQKISYLFSSNRLVDASRGVSRNDLRGVLCVTAWRRLASEINGWWLFWRRSSIDFFVLSIARTFKKRFTCSVQLDARRDTEDDWKLHSLTFPNQSRLFPPEKSVAYINNPWSFNSHWHGSSVEKLYAFFYQHRKRLDSRAVQQNLNSETSELLGVWNQEEENRE